MHEGSTAIAPNRVEDGLLDRLDSDPEAFANLYELYLDRVYLYLLRRTGTAEDAADLTQQVFLKAFRLRSRYRPSRGSFASWLFTIARSVANSTSIHAGRLVSWDCVAEGATESTPGPEDVGIEVDEFDRLNACFGRIDPRGQELILLRFEGGLKVPEIAAVVGKSTESTKKYLQRTLKRLRDMYDDDFE